MNRHTHIQPQKRAARDKRGPGAPHTHCRHTTSATRRPAREERTAHTQFKFECDRAPSECAGPGSRRGRRHGLQHDGDGAASRRRYGGGRVYMELTITGQTSRPAGGLVWPDGVKASSMESPDGGTRPTGATEQHRRSGPAAGGRSRLAQRRTGAEKATAMQIPGSAYQAPPQSSYWMRKRPKSYESAARSLEPEGRPTAW